VQVRTGLWRTLRPIVDTERCRKCVWVCGSLCPDGVIFPDVEGHAAIDFDHCKGCLVCLAQCPWHAIEAVPERAARDSGFLQIHCATCQEIVDAILIAYRLAEDAAVRLPVIVNLDGFYLSFTREPVDLPDTEAAARFLPPFDAGTLAFRAGHPVSEAVAVLGGGPYSYFRYQIHLAAEAALDVFDQTAGVFEATFGRRYEAVERYRMDDADVAFLMIESFATKAKAAVGRLRAAGHKVGLVRPRLLRPFPEAALRAALKGVKGVAVVDQNLSMGKGGILFAEVASALYGLDGAPVLVSFIGGLGGRDIDADDFAEMAAVTQKAADTGEAPPPRLLFDADELAEVRKLQTLAAVEWPKESEPEPEPEPKSEEAAS